MVQRHNAKQRHYWMIAACGLLMSTSALQGCKDDTVLTGQPSWLGNSIYERLEEDGNYTTVLKLIDDLGLHEVLSHTGSKTLFVANDSAYQQWFGNDNPWGVHSYDKLSLAQKKLLLNNSMVNNAYLIELLSNVSGRPPKEGMCMRRETASSVYDSVQILRPDQMPNTDVWKKFKDNGKSIPILKDATAAPMIHFLPAFMEINKITASDLDVLTNHKASDTKEAWVNGKKVVARDITCKNGYIQKVDGVIESSPNMAEIIRQNPEMSRWSELLDRFSAPYFDENGTKEYNRLYNNQDSVYTLRYYSKLSAGGTENTVNPNKEEVQAYLSFDPGWNHYMYSNTMDYTLNYDAGVMIVPTNDALDNWLENEGKDLKTEYGSWEDIPDEIIVKLINVNMLSAFTNAVPSKFDGILNDAKEQLGIKTEDVKSCYMGCNGVVYLVNNVYAPAEYSSVAYPALAHPSIMNVIYWAMAFASMLPENSQYTGSALRLNFLPYLLSMNSQYSLLLPTNNAMLWYIDPASYGAMKDGKEAPTILEFYYDENKNLQQRVQARRYECVVEEDGTITKGEELQASVSNDVIVDCLCRLMDQLIIVGDVEDGHEYYKSKGGTPIRVTRENGQLSFAGGWQIDHKKSLPVNADEIYVKSNGRSYQLNDQMPLPTQKSVYKTLEGREEFSEFLKLLEHDGSELMAKKMRDYSAGLSTGKTDQNNKNLRLLDNYNYTVYVPQNDSIRKLIDDGLLPTWDDYEAQTDSIWGSEEAAQEAQNIIKDIIVNFIRYHVQDHAIAINMAPESYDVKDGVKIPHYENTFESMRRNPETNRFYPLTVNNANGQMWVKDQYHSRARNVVKSDGLYNCLCREYWFKGSENTATTFTASDVFVHQIDGVLLSEPLTPWRKKLSQIKRK